MTDDVILTGRFITQPEAILFFSCGRKSFVLQIWLLNWPPKGTKSVDFNEKIIHCAKLRGGSTLEVEAIKVSGLRDACVVKTPDRHETP